MAPIFGYKFDLIVSSLNDLGAEESALTSPEVVDPAAYGGYAGYTEPQAGSGQGYRMMPVRSGLASLSALGASLTGVLTRSEITSPLSHLTAWLDWGGTYTHISHISHISYTYIIYTYTHIFIYTHIHTDRFRVGVYWKIRNWRTRPSYL